MTPRRICFVTGTRAEFGLMESTLRRIALHPDLSLRIVATGMHLDRSRGRTLAQLRGGGWNIDATVPWRSGADSQAAAALATGRAMSGLASLFEKFQSDIVLVAGDRVEAFAAASAAHIGGRLVAHVHGGDRALGLVDDSLRHAITKLAHLHFPATPQSAARIERMGEDRWRIVRAGSPGIDDIRATAASREIVATHFPTIDRRRYALLILHPETPNADAEARKAKSIAQAVRSAGFHATIIIYPNNDPGSAGIIRAWDALARGPAGAPPSRPERRRALDSPPSGLTGAHDVLLRRNLARDLYLGLLRDAAVLVGNSSSGIIEAATFGVPVIDIGQRQAGRERGANVTHVPAAGPKLNAALRGIWNGGHPVRHPARNPYGNGGAGRRIVQSLSTLPLDRFRRKLIAY